MGKKMKNFVKKQTQMLAIKPIRIATGSKNVPNLEEIAIDTNSMHLRFASHSNFFKTLPSVEQLPDTTYRMALYPPASFWAGIRASSVGGSDMAIARHSPHYRVFLSKPLLVLDHQVTQEFWDVVVKLFQKNDALNQFPYNAVRAKPSKFKGSKKPINAATWVECILFCNMLSMLQGFEPYYEILKAFKIKQYPWDKTESLFLNVKCKQTSNGYRLPTSAEMTYLYKVGFKRGFGITYENVDVNDYVVANRSQWSFDQKYADDLLWRKFSSDWDAIKAFKKEKQKEEVGPLRVKSKKPNAYGVYDLMGNVSEMAYDMPHVSWKNAYFAEIAKNDDGRVVDPIFSLNDSPKIYEYLAYQMESLNRKKHTINDEKGIERDYFFTQKALHGGSFDQGTHNGGFDQRGLSSGEFNVTEIDIYEQNEQAGFRFVRNL